MLIYVSLYIAIAILVSFRIYEYQIYEYILLVIALLSKLLSQRVALSFITVAIKVIKVAYVLL